MVFLDEGANKQTKTSKKCKLIGFSERLQNKMFFAGGCKGSGSLIEETALLDKSCIMSKRELAPSPPDP